LSVYKVNTYRREMHLTNTITKDQAEIIFKEYSEYIYRVALFLTKSSALADDIAQETFIQVFRKYHTYKQEKPFKPWIYKIALNTTRNVFRKQKVTEQIDEIPEGRSLESVEASVLKAEEEEELWKEINKLSFKSKEVIVLHFYSGMKLNEISNALGIPLGTCKSRLNTALTTLKKKLMQSSFSFSIEGGNIYETI
jgi:RNA polymerase sigma factor (sigma-70 family)